MPPSDLLSALLDLVRATACDSAHPLDPRDVPETQSAPPVVYKRVLAHALGLSNGCEARRSLQPS